MTRLLESATLTPGGNHKWLVQLISEGAGSSGYYSGDLLQRDGPMAWPAGTHVFADHLTESDMMNRNGSHSIKDLVGVTMTDATYMPGNKSLQSEVKWFDPQFESFVEAAQADIALSVEASGTINEAGIIESISPSPMNAVAVVPRGGRDGKILSLIESYRENRGTISTDANEGKDMAVTPEDITAIVEGIVAGIKPTLDTLTEALKPAAPETVETEDGVLDVAAVAEAVAEAALPKSARSKVYEAVQGGAKVEDAIAAQKTFIEELKESLAVEDGKIVESAIHTDDFTVTGW